MKGLFHQIHLNEAHNVRNFFCVRSGIANRASNTRSRFAYTGITAYDKLEDIAGLLAFLERPS